MSDNIKHITQSTPEQITIVNSLFIQFLLDRVIKNITKNINAKIRETKDRVPKLLKSHITSISANTIQITKRINQKIQLLIHFLRIFILYFVKK